VESSDQDLKPPAATGTSSRGLEIKGAGSKPRESAEDSRRSSQASVRTPTGSAPPADPHAAERAARDRERLLRETRRMASLAGAAGAKRSRDEGDESRRSSRRKGRRGEVVSVDDEEERMRRLEAERESARFRDD